MIEPVSPERHLRICVVGDLDGVHTRSWLRFFVQRGHDVHGISYYAPARPPDGVTVHSLRSGDRAAAASGATGSDPSASVRLGRRLPPGLQRLIYLLRYRSAGLRPKVEEIAPDVLHGHYLVEHAFYGTAAGFHPYVVTAWGSDVLVDADRSLLSRGIARFALSKADLATANNRHMAREMVVRLGKEQGAVQHIVLGVEQSYLDGSVPSVNEMPPREDRAPTVISTRSLDSSLYNVDVIVRAMARVRERLPAARLVVAGEGRLRPQLEALAAQLGLGEAVSFTGFLQPVQFRAAVAGAEVFVSVPSSDGTSVAVLQALAAGCFPIVSVLRSQHELMEEDAGGLRVPVRDDVALADAIVHALEDAELRRNAVEPNRRFVEEYGVLETNLAKMEAWYYRLAGRFGEVGGGTVAE